MTPSLPFAAVSKFRLSGGVRFVPFSFARSPVRSRGLDGRTWGPCKADADAARFPCLYPSASDVMMAGEYLAQQVLQGLSLCWAGCISNGPAEQRCDSRGRCIRRCVGVRHELFMSAAFAALE